MPKPPSLAELLEAYLEALRLAPVDVHAALAVGHLAHAIRYRLLLLLPVIGCC